MYFGVYLFIFWPARLGRGDNYVATIGSVSSLFLFFIFYFYLVSIVEEERRGKQLGRLAALFWQPPMVEERKGRVNTRLAT